MTTRIEDIEAPAHEDDPVRRYDEWHARRQGEVVEIAQAYLADFGVPELLRTIAHAIQLASGGAK